jgi:transcription elongation factor Elf1
MSDDKTRIFKLCPVCGGESVLLVQKDTGDAMVHCVECPNAKETAIIVKGLGFDSAQLAIDRWNVLK